MVPVTRVEVEVEVHKREVLENISKEVKEDLTRTKMVPDEEWTKTLNSSDMDAQFEVLNRQLLDIESIDNPVDEHNDVQDDLGEEFTRSCSYCNSKFEWMAQLVKHILTDHKPIGSDTTDPMWYMVGELLAEVRDEQVSIREESENFSRGMLQSMDAPFLFEH